MLYNLLMVELDKYLMIDSSYETIYKKNNSFLGEKENISVESLYYNIITDVDIILNTLCVSPSKAGYRYWRDAVFIYITNFKMPISICNDIYPVIGLKYGKTSASVERAMRICFEDVMYNISKKESNYVIAYLKNHLLFPHNSEILLRLVELVVSKNFQSEKNNYILSKW